MLKVDKKIVEEFLGTTDVQEIISNCKCSRYYFRSNNIGDGILILTPILQEDGIYLNQLLAAQQMAGHPLKATEHKRGKNYVYTYEEIQSVVKGE